MFKATELQVCVSRLMMPAVLLAPRESNSRLRMSHELILHGKQANPAAHGWLSLTMSDVTRQCLPTGCSTAVRLSELLCVL